MRTYLRKTGIAAAILVAVCAIAFLPKQVSQWVVLSAVALCAIWNGIRFTLSNNEFFKDKRIENSEETVSEKACTIDDTSEYLKYTIQQLSHRITDKLHSAYPDSSWRWAEKPTMQLFTSGGRIRITTSDTEEFNEADVLLDSIGRIDILMLKTSQIGEVISAVSENAEKDFTVDPEIWYEQRGRQALMDIISDLNARGTKNIKIGEDGCITLENSQQVAALEAFPAKNLWAKLIELLERDNLKTVEADDSIQVSW